MNIFQDYKRNKKNIKGQIILILFRISHIPYNNKFLFIIWVPYLIAYRVFVEWILGIEIPYKTEIGKGLVVFHGHALVVNDGTVIGENCVLRHCTTIGNKQLPDGSYSTCPRIGNNVDVGANVCIIGPISIGNNVTIGAGSTVVKDVPANCIVVGNPARIIKYLNVDSL
ncbi:serine acetyltransferase [Siphonobacter sp. SORGH_AS_0500]|uniref:serine O-acetyltransferase n=1 Tax=Siphonobacter sp. SORGH_AS_0500 TaxID=1864824 RepID=UPI00285C75FA|nr:serine acetyltransferase [Siphonobacter sp. SORGH_AS_0500]MDR6196889.1 putative colanic acid biosynthesis acetyltransferase WcaB [Siphonobacter sp. SORGH_AS_0500]